MTVALRLDGKALAATLRQEYRTTIEARVLAGHPRPGLAVVLVGTHGPSETYVRNKRKACDDAGLTSTLIRLPDTCTTTELLTVIEQLNRDPAVHGILVQLPLPRQIDEQAVLLAIHPTKDVDAFHPENVGRLTIGQPRFWPCTPAGCLVLLERYGQATAGREVVVVGRSNIVGKPLALLLMQKRTPANPRGGDATVTVAHTGTRNLAEVTRRAEILIVAAGQPQVITPEMIRPGAVVVDVGTNVVAGQLVGDVAPGAESVAAALSPVPGGVGPMTIAMLLENTLRAAQLLQPAVVG